MNNAETSGLNPSIYRPDVDGLRAVAVLAVLGFHFFPGRVPGGFVGVDIFFVISGFLITGIILDDLLENKFSFLNFYARRLRRLFPALAVVLFFTLAVGWLVLFPEEYKTLGKHTAGGAGFISNILYWRESGYFDAEAARKPLLHLWSLGIEEQFYLAFPFLLCWVWKRGFRESILITLVLAASLAYTLHLEHRDQATGFYSPLARFWELLVGAVLACLSRAPVASKPRRAALKIDGLLAGLIYKKSVARAGLTLGHLLSGMGIIILALAIFTFRERPTWPGHWAITPVVGAALLIAAGQRSFFNHHFLANRLAVAIGLISYPLYLWHWPILAYLRILNGGPPEKYHRVLAALVALALAGLTYTLVERPFRFGPSFRTSKTLVLAFLLAVAAGAGLFIYVRDGLPERGLKNSEYEIPNYRDKEDCRDDIGMHSSAFYGECRFSGGHGPMTVALIGNSHAASAYFGVEKFNASIGLNTLLLSKGGEPLLIGGEVMCEGKCDKDRYQESVLLSFEFLLNREDIKFIFIIISSSRAPIMQAYLQPTVDKLTKAGKKVFLLVGWPYLPRPGVDYVARPYSEIINPRATAEHWRKLDRNLVLKDRQKYLQIMRSIKNVTLIDGTWDAFCPGRECLVFSEAGRLLYYDSGHLTNAGSEFLTERVLAPYLVELAVP